MRIDRTFSIKDLRRMAQRRLPTAIFDYLDGGADDEWSIRRNCAAFTDYELIPDVLLDTSAIRTSTLLFGREVAFPMMLSPTGLTRLFHPHAELAVARAAHRQKLMFGLSTMGSTRLESLAEATSGPKVFQVYIFKDRGLTAEFVDRCRGAGFDGLILTVDTPVAGNRERDHVNGLSLPPKLTMQSWLSFALHPRWSWSALTGTAFDFPNVSHRVDPLARGPISLFEYIAGQFDRTLTWQDLEWLASKWGGPIAVKGVMTPEDARRAVAYGATGIMVSNHGGRQLDGAPAPIDQIAAIRAAVGSSVEVICDGGIRRGSDVVKALALGANACSVGRPYLYGLAAGGEVGVHRALSLLCQEFERTMILLGVPDIARLTPRHVHQARSQRIGSCNPHNSCDHQVSPS